jgi:DNA-binding NarL/FixJ family response regulator
MGRSFMAPPARVFVIDDHPVVRLGIRQMIGSDQSLSVCGEVGSSHAVLQRINESMPDLVIIDLSLEGGISLDLIARLHDARPELPVLVLSIHDELLFAERTLRAGARGYIMKGEAINGLLDAIHQVLSGHVYLSSRMSQHMAERIGHTGTQTVGLASLTNRELEVFQMIGRGLNTQMIAAQLGVSVKTIETYRSNIKTKLDLKDATDLIRHAAVWATTRW